MPRAGMVTHPNVWEWCGYHELIGWCQRLRLLDIDRLVELFGLSNKQSWAESHQ